MNDNNQEDFSFFAGGNRVKKTETKEIKSPLSATNKWDIQEETPAPKVNNHRVETPYKLNTEIQSTSNIETKSTEEPIGNIGSELQKFRKYPEKKYDQLLSKVVTFNEEDFYLIRDLASEISMTRKRSSIPNKGALPRITENTIIRAALKAVFSKIGNSNLDLTTLQTEEALENYFNNLLK
jgi:hypothetical protein